MVEFFRRCLDKLKGEGGQTLIEYVLVVVLIAIVLILAFRTSGIVSAINAASSSIGSTITSGASQPGP